MNVTGALEKTTLLRGWSLLLSRTSFLPGVALSLFTIPFSIRHRDFSSHLFGRLAAAT